MLLMTDADWTEIESEGHFRRSEWKDDPLKVNRDVVYKVRNMRIEAGCKCHIHCAYQQSGHATNSQHYIGNAVDLNFEDMPLAEQIELAVKHGFSGIGAYPGWNEPGIHCDIRASIHKPNTYWIEPADKKGTAEYVYYPSVDELLKALA